MRAEPGSFVTPARESGDGVVEAKMDRVCDRTQAVGTLGPSGTRNRASGSTHEPSSPPRFHSGPPLRGSLLQPPNVRYGGGVGDRVIEVFADIVCPFTHVGLRRLVERRTATGRTSPVLHVRAWPLELVNGEPLAGDFVGEEVVALREHVTPDLFGGFDPARFPSTSLPALTLTAAAYRVDAQLGEQVSLALRDALFEEGADIGAFDVLAEIAAAHGLDVPEGVDRDAITADLDEGRRRGVQGSPHFFLGSEGFFCPSLEITRVGGHLQVAFDPKRFEQFARQALDGPMP